MKEAPKTTKFAIDFINNPDKKQLNKVLIHSDDLLNEVALFANVNGEGKISYRDFLNSLYTEGLVQEIQFVRTVDPNCIKSYYLSKDWSIQITKKESTVIENQGVICHIEILLTNKKSGREVKYNMHSNISWIEVRQWNPKDNIIIDLRNQISELKNWFYLINKYEKDDILLAFIDNALRGEKCIEDIK